MRRIALALVLVLTCSAAADDAAERAKFAGTWKVKEGTTDGQPLPPEAKEASRLVFAGDKFSFKSALVTMDTTYTLDPAKGTMVVIPPKGETKTLQGRYKFEDKTLTLCLTDKAEFPADLKGGPDRMVLVLEREK
jgi:uncharacterized protein (TIGR03067 family)